jgi:hypothetical protein
VFSPDVGTGRLPLGFGFLFSTKARGFLLSIELRADHHQGAEPIVLEPDVKVHPIDPHVDVLTAGEVALAPRQSFLLACCLNQECYSR